MVAGAKPATATPAYAAQTKLARAIATGENAETVVLNLMNPAGAARRGFSRGRQARFDNPRTGAGTLTQRHGGLIGIAAQGVESVWPRTRGFGGTGQSGATDATGYATWSQLVEPTTVPNIPALMYASLVESLVKPLWLDVPCRCRFEEAAREGATRQSRRCCYRRLCCVSERQPKESSQCGPGRGGWGLRGTGATDATRYATRSQLIEPSAVPNIPALRLMAAQ